MRSSHKAMLTLAMIAAVADSVADPYPRESRADKPKPQEPRRFTDARKAEAEAKRQRKAAKRAKAVQP